jgi:transcriptional regulator with XRE-family HTH domain
MERRRWEQKDLAREAQLTPGAVSRHLDRERPPSLVSVQKYEKALGVSLLEPREPTVTRVDTRDLHPVEAVLEEQGWAAAAGLTLAQAEVVVTALESLRTAVRSPMPRSVWRDERDRLARAARSVGGPKLASPIYSDSTEDRDAAELAAEKKRLADAKAERDAKAKRKKR